MTLQNCIFYRSIGCNTDSHHSKTERPIKPFGVRWYAAELLVPSMADEIILLHLQSSTMETFSFRMPSLLVGLSISVAVQLLLMTPVETSKLMNGAFHKKPRDVWSSSTSLAAVKSSSVVSSVAGCSSAGKLCCQGKNNTCRTEGPRTSNNGSFTCFCDSACDILQDCCTDYRQTCLRKYLYLYNLTT